MKFWWRFNPNKSDNFTSKAWNSICQPKSMGVLRLRSQTLTKLFFVSKLVDDKWEQIHLEDNS